MYPTMRQKRSQPETTAVSQDLHVQSHFVHALAQEQDAGTNFYGQAIYPAAKRARRCQARCCKPFVNCFQGIDRQLTFNDAVDHTNSMHACADPVPALPEPTFPSHILGYHGSSLRGSRDLDSDVAVRSGGLALPFSKEEDRLLLDARSLGRTFVDIAKMLPARNVTQLRKHYSMICKPKPPPMKRPSPPIHVSPAPIPVPAVAQEGAMTAIVPAIKAASRQPPLAPPRASPTPCEAVEVDYRCTDRSGADTRVQLLKPLQNPPKGFTGLKAHKLATLDGIKFFQKAEVVDPDDASKIYCFDMDDPQHCACFNIGESDVVDEQGQASPVISWSDLHVLYQLPDGTKWAEHGNFYDCEDLIKHARELHKDHQAVLPKDATDRELLKKAGRSHSRLQNIEFECWVFKDKLPAEVKLAELAIAPDNAYYSRITFDPKTLDRLP
ncbi:TPA: hypothetical protein ACH3X1_014596 [Trebouxia sp. C0004]